MITEEQRLKICDNCEYHIRSPQTDKIVNWDACQLGAYITEKICAKHLEYQSAITEEEVLGKVWDTKVHGCYVFRSKYAPLKKMLEQAQAHVRAMGLEE